VHASRNYDGFLGTTIRVVSFVSAAAAGLVQTGDKIGHIERQVGANGVDAGEL
jgi:hypothetical protein